MISSPPYQLSNRVNHHGRQDGWHLLGHHRYRLLQFVGSETVRSIRTDVGSRANDFEDFGIVARRVGRDLEALFCESVDDEFLRLGHEIFNGESVAFHCAAPCNASKSSSVAFTAVR